MNKTSSGTKAGSLVGRFAVEADDGHWTIGDCRNKIQGVEE